MYATTIIHTKEYESGHGFLFFFPLLGLDIFSSLRFEFSFETDRNMKSPSNENIIIIGSAKN